jgi:hypothetical protein
MLTYIESNRKQTDSGVPLKQAPIPGRLKMVDAAVFCRVLVTLTSYDRERAA